MVAFFGDAAARYATASLFLSLQKRVILLNYRRYTLQPILYPVV
jgi:hypothetical protein